MTKQKRRRSLALWVTLAIGAATVVFLGPVAAVLLTRAWYVDHFEMMSGSMRPSYQIGDVVLVNKRAYGETAPDRGDVVVLLEPGQDVYMMKRVVGLPGEEIGVSSGRLVVNGTPSRWQREGNHLLEAVGERAWHIRVEGGGGPDVTKVKLGPDEYYVLGDNRSYSHDSRQFGPLPRARIEGRVETRLTMADDQS